MTSIAIAAAAFALAAVYSSFFEWALHRFIMHSARFLRYPHRAHQLEHHAIFRADATYFLTRGLHEESAEKHLTFAWWNAPLLIALHGPILAGLYLLAGAWAAGGAVAAMVSYYGLYEYLHYCMHVPRGRRLERTRFFRFVQAHHRLHHVYYHKNLNVVLPIADFLLGSRVGGQEELFDKLESARLRRLERAGHREPHGPRASRAPRTSPVAWPTV
ncbi:MAG: fatty acid hydroxylase [Planctomycetes bacterium]|nr:fatty acid hydroxylase [Planctomycetota bacterium]